MNLNTVLSFEAEVQHTLLRADGTTIAYAPDKRTLRKPISYWRMLYNKLKPHVPLFASMSLGAFIEWMTYDPRNGYSLGLVTTAGVNYMATAFTSSSNPINNFNYHTYGTGGAHGGTSTVTGATNASPIVITATAHGYTTNDIVTIASVGGNTAANGTWQITVTGANTFSLIGSTGNSAYTSGGTGQLVVGAGDTAMTTEASGLTRVAGTQSNPSANIYRSVATVTFTGTTPSLSIIEWGLFSALTTGTLWDRRWLNTSNAPSTTATGSLTSAPITITQTTDSIQTTYNLTCTAGGS